MYRAAARRIDPRLLPLNGDTPSLLGGDGKQVVNSGRALDTTVNIETPEHVLFSCAVAGPARRALAYLVDLLVRVGIVAVVGFVLLLATAGSKELSGWKVGALLLLLFALEWGYFVASEMLMNGRSIGKRLLGLRVVTHEGLPVSFGGSMLRNLLRAADFLPTGYAVGLLTMTLDPRFRRLGDWAANTMVIVEERPRLREPVRLQPPAQPAELAALPSRLDLPGPVLEALELFLRRAPELQSLREDELASMLAPLYAQRLNLGYQSAARFLGLLYAHALREGHRAR